MNDTNGVALVLAFTDLDDDGRQDFYIGNDGTRADFMHNLGGMRFKNIAVEIGVTVGRGWTPMAAMGADWADFDRDGLLDLTVTDFQNNCFALFRHQAYEKATASVRTASRSSASKPAFRWRPASGLASGPSGSTWTTTDGPTSVTPTATSTIMPGEINAETCGRHDVCSVPAAGCGVPGGGLRCSWQRASR